MGMGIPDEVGALQEGASSGRALPTGGGRPHVRRNLGHRVSRGVDPLSVVVLEHEAPGVAGDPQLGHAGFADGHPPLVQLIPAQREELARLQRENKQPSAG